jgi:hypothetical protein
MLAMAVRRDRVHPDWEGGHAPLTAGRAPRETPRPPALPCGSHTARHQLAPPDGTPPRARLAVMRGVDPVLHPTRPPRAQLPLQSLGPRPGLVRSRPIPGPPMDQARRPGRYRPTPGRRRGPVAQPRPRGQHPAPTPRQLRLVWRGHAPGPAAQRGQPGRSAVPPLVRHRRAITDHHARPARAPRGQGRRTPARLPCAPGHRGMDPHPQPRQHPMLIPGGRVEVMPRHLSGLLSHGLVRRRDGVSHPLHHAWEGAPAEGPPKTAAPPSCIARRLARGPQAQRGGGTARSAVGARRAWRWPGGPGGAPGRP